MAEDNSEETGFVGRTAETAALARLLAEGRLVTVTGPGGVGKTRVALRAASRAVSQTARQSAERFPGGVHVAELSGLKDPELLPSTIAASLGMPRQESRQQLDVVLDHLRSRSLLLVLDTCEHLVEECALFAEAVLRDAPGVTVLATSRQALDVAGERVFSLPPLPVPTDAADLFALRAAAADPGFSATEATRPDVVRVCRSLDGMPLAIELAAVQLRALSLRELAGRLDERIGLLAAHGSGKHGSGKHGSGKHGGGTPRHQTLEAAIEWSHDLCTDAERTLWARLAVFPATFDAAAVREVCAGRGLPADEIMCALVGLVEKSVVMRDGDRYRMLDTIREFGAVRLAESGQDTIYRGRHLGWCLAEARSFDEHFLDHDQPERMRMLRTETDSIRAAIQYGLASENEQLVRDGAELAVTLYGYWMASGLLREGRYWLGLALEKLPAGPSPERAWALVTRAFLGPVAGEAGEAADEANHGVAMARELGDDGPLLARGCLFRQFALMFAGQTEEASRAGEEARRRFTALEDRTGLLILEGQTAYLKSASGDFQGALDACKRGLDGLRAGRENGEIGEQWLQGFLYLNAGLARFFQGGYEDAERCCATALPIQAALEDIHGCWYAIWGLAWLAAHKDQWTRAAWLLGAASTLWKQLGTGFLNDAVLEMLRQETEDSTRQGLGERRFGELLAVGARLSLDQVARYATIDTDELALPEGVASR